MKSKRDKLNVLIIDSPDENIENVYRFFKEEGLTTHYAKDAVEGVEKCENENIHLIILDALTYPLNGYEAVRRIRGIKKLEHIPVIMCSDRNDSYDKIWAKEQGVNIYLVKPINRDIVINAAKRLLKSRVRK